MTALPFGGKNNCCTRASNPSDPVQRTDGGLQSRDVGDPHLEDVALAAGNPPAVLDLGQGPQALLDAGVVDGVALDHADQRGDVQPDGLGVEDGAVGTDHAGGLQLAHPLVHRG
jgi:hypothetical protein